VLPANADTFVQHIRAIKPSCHIQAAVSHRISTLSHIAMVTQAERRGTGGVAELARLRALEAQESSRWLQVLPTDPYLRLSDVQWQWAAQLRLGMQQPAYEPAGGNRRCKSTLAADEDGWHALTCIHCSGPAIIDRHNSVVSRLAHFARVLTLRPRTEPHHLAADDERRPDIQLDLPDVTLLGDVTISHPAAKCWQRVTASRGVEAVGDSREAEKDGLYADMAKQIGMEFSAFVLYSYGGTHKSAVSFIRRLGTAADPATCLMSYTQWKRELMEQVAIAVQRGNANIMIQDSIRRRGRTWPRRGKADRHSTAPRSRGGVRHKLAAATKMGQPGANGADAMAHVARMARMIGLLDPKATCIQASPEGADSDAETVSTGDDTASLPSVIPETPLSVGSDVRTAGAMDAPPSDAPGAQDADVQSHEQLANDVRSGGHGGLCAPPLVSMAEELMDDNITGMAVHSGEETEDRGSCSVRGCSALSDAEIGDRGSRSVRDCGALLGAD